MNWGRAAKNRRLADQNQEQRETLALLTRLLSHNIRNDMSLIDGHAAILTDHIDEEGHSHLQVIRDRVSETDQLLTDANALVKLLDKDREFEPIDLSSVLEREVATLREDHPAVAVETDVPSGVTVEADNLLRQLFSNLLQNAVLHNDPEDPRIRVTVEQTGDDALVTISDNGRGLPAEIRESCFELGEQGPESNGDGIGLYLVSRLADVYGGSVDVDDVPGGGARFRVTLPVVGAPRSG